MNILFLGNNQLEFEQLQQYVHSLGGTVKQRKLENNFELVALVDALARKTTAVVDQDLFVIGDLDIDDTIKGYIIGVAAPLVPLALVSEVFSLKPFLAYHALVDDILGKNIASIAQYKKVLEQYERGSEEFVDKIIETFQPFRAKK